MGNIRDAFNVLEDYHYQDQTDPPEGIRYQDFKKRGKKWDKLLDYRNAYAHLPQFVILDEYCIRRLFQKHWFTGEKDLYKDFAYKFDTPPEEVLKKEFVDEVRAKLRSNE